MRYHCLACDYDGTLAHHGRVDEATRAALERVRATGRKLVMVTGRELDDLIVAFPEVPLFDWIVAENGALLYHPATRSEKVLGEPPSREFVATLHERYVRPLSVGRVIVATWQPHEKTVLEAIKASGLELQVIFNKGAVMVLPAGINKATGLAAALREMELSPHEVVGVGDAENDHAFLTYCAAAVAVANALAPVKERVDWVTAGDHGRGVIELIEALLADDLQALDAKLTRRHLRLGQRDDSQVVRLPPYGQNILIAGPSGSGKSTAATSFLERLAEQHYQFCIIDPEGDYENLEHAVVLGNTKGGPNVEEVLGVLKNTDANPVVNLVGMAMNDRPGFFLALLPRLQEMRAKTGRPHWLIIDEAHHLLPLSWEPGAKALSPQMKGLLFITVHPDQVAPAALAGVDTVLAVGPEPATTLAQVCKVLDEPQPVLPHFDQEQGEVVVWRRWPGSMPMQLKLVPARSERVRHSRKYAEGELPPDRSFYFRGPKNRLKLRAQNLMLFLQIGEGVDDDTWLHHLRQGDYSRWFRDNIKDPMLASEAAAIEKQKHLSPDESRARFRECVEHYYVLPAAARDVPGNSTPAA